MISMLYMSLFWKVHNDYKKTLREREIKCKGQFYSYLKYLETKNIKINNYVSIGESIK